ncbi:MAG: transporter substrate-binding domain-containing protein [Colwellia sp.]|nr:transporter substrate-binding domain-containing protein [Colwellia sp.]
MLKNMLRRFQISIRLTLVSLFLIATSLTAIIAIGLHYHFSMSFASESARNSFQITAKYTRDYLSSIDDSATQVTKVLAQHPTLLNSYSLTSSTDQVFAQIMETNPIFYSIYIAQHDGLFTQLINLDASPLIRKQFSASINDRWLKVTSSTKLKRRSVQYLDSNFTIRHTQESESEYDPTKRLWFQKANVGTIHKSAPYQFNSLQDSGLTFSTTLAHNKSVLGIDIALSSLSLHLQNHQLPKGSEIYLYQANGELIATSTNKESQFKIPDALPITLTAEQKLAIAQKPVVSISNSKDWMPIDFAITGQPQGYAVDVLKLVSQMTGITFDYVNGFTWSQLVSKFESGELDALQAVYNTPINKSMGVMSESFLSMPFAVVTKENIEPITKIQSLNGKTLAIAKGWSITEIIKEKLPLINILEFNTPIEAISAVQLGHADAAIDSRIILKHMISQYFIDDLVLQPIMSFSPIDMPESLHMLLHAKDSELLPIINIALKNITAKQKSILGKKWLATKIDSSINHSINVPYKTLITKAKQLTNHNSLMKEELPNGEHFIFISPISMSNNVKTYFAVVTPYDVIVGPSLAKVKISIIMTVLCLLLMLPLSYIFAVFIEKPIKRLVVQNNLIKRRKYDEVTTPFSHIKELDELANSLTDMASSIQQHENNQKQLMESFIKLIAQAIDDKSPYTAGHCERVPELGIMLVEAASKSNFGCFSDFSLETEEQQREFRVAAWLHDCGKITTPEHIVDKATKLETIYNRIHEIRMRFEVLWRDAEIIFYKKILLEPDSGAFHQQELKRTRKKLTDDFAFIAESNIGGEFMGEDKVERLLAISQQTWVRHFDDRLGLSPQELAKQSGEEVTLPVTEKILIDKAKHIEVRTQNKTYDPSFGIKMNIPDKLYNRGELYNLSISRGTLTNEDRFKINEHVISTIRMLDNLPFPPELANVPRYASTHHETLIGTGYPRKLVGEDLSIPERILVLADIFEALTAADRPYKKAKPLSVAIKIMHKMVLDQHIDQEVFELFLTSGVYADYAKKYLPSDQLDSLNINIYLNIKDAV